MIRWRNHRRVLLAVRLLAETGVSTALDLCFLLGKALHINPKAGSVRRLVYGTLRDEYVVRQLVEHRSLPFVGRGGVRVLTLTEDGKALARAMGVEPVESDWERLVRLHAGEKQTNHAAAILVAAYEARLRGWKAEVVPFDPNRTPWFQPDLKITDPQGKVYYCEVETRSRGRQQKWASKREVNLIAISPESRRAVVQFLRAMSVSGRATDLKTLMSRARTGDLSQFWLEEW